MRDDLTTRETFVVEIFVISLTTLTSNHKTPHENKHHTISQVNLMVAHRLDGMLTTPTRG